MSVKIKLSTLGKHNYRTFGIVATDSRKPNGGKFLEKLGFYDPKNDKLVVNKENLMKWINNGAILTETLESLLKKNNIKLNIVE